MIDKVSRDVVSILMKGNIPVQNPEQVKQAEQRRKLDMSKFNTSRSEQGDDANEQNKRVQPVRVEKKVGRNDPCPCGAINPDTNKPYKYKRCGLINASYHNK